MNVSGAKAVLLWYRLDLRVSDHPALEAALATGLPMVPVFIWDPESEGPWAPGRNSRWWLGRSLEALDADLRARGSRLLFREGETGALLRSLAEETGAEEIHYSRRYEPLVEKHEARVGKSLRAAGLRMVRHRGNLLREPETLRTQGGTPFKVFTPFWKSHLFMGEIAPPLLAPRSLPAPARWPESPAWTKVRRILAKDGEAATPGLEAHWSPGSAGAESALKLFLKDALEDYPEYRNIPAAPGTSRLSPHLHFGEISPRMVFHALSPSGGLDGRLARSEAASVFRKELGWRDFAHHVLVNFPHTSDQPLRPEFSAFPWRKSKATLDAWRQGRTGFPFIDAAQRELLATGYMHNRSRMATASFLVKDLLIPWQEGARWFWDLLVDADLAQNSLNWQWVAGCGADAAPYFRIFNPQSQGERFDPHGDYVRRWVPELATGDGYPAPMVDHAKARDLALAAFRSLSGK